MVTLRSDLGIGECKLCLFTIVFLWQQVAVAQQMQIPTSKRSISAEFNVAKELNQGFAEKELQLGSPVFIRIFKESSELEVWVKRGDQFQLYEIYPICTYSGQLGPKLRQGDQQSPEGFYFVNPGRLNPNSSYHLSFNLGYPNTYDRAHGRTGSFLMVHGSCVSIGCYAMTNSGIEQIYTIASKALAGGQPYFRVHVFPFRMSQEKLDLHKGSIWHTFWLNLKDGYDWFEERRMPPNVRVEGKKYVFEKD